MNLLTWAGRLKRGAQFASKRLSAQGRELDRLAAMPRHTPTVTHVLGHPVEVPDAASFVFMHSEIFERELYRFVPTRPQPLIIDGGANIGLSVLYFKRLCPDARVLAFEPDAAIFGMLQRNVAHAGVTGVELVPKALWTSQGELEFMVEGADGGRVVETAGHLPRVRVPTVRLRDHLDQPVELLKLDIEGAETEVLQDCQDHLGKVSRVFVEYHSFANRPQTLHVVAGILQRAGFRISVAAPGAPLHPFIRGPAILGMDMQLNMFAFREPRMDP